MSQLSQVQLSGDFTSLAFKVYRFLGWNPFDNNSSTWSKVYFALAIFYTTLCLVQEIIYFVLHFGDENTFLSLTNLTPCMGFVALALVKVFTIYWNRKRLGKIVKKLESFQENHENKIKGIVKTSRLMMKSQTILFLVLIWIFNLMPLCVIVYWFVVDGSYHREMPYFMWYPWNCLQPFIYELCYTVVMWGAFSCSIGILSTDLMFCSIVILLCLRFNSLSDRIRQVVDSLDSRKLLRAWIVEHCELIKIVDEVAEIFSMSLLINFFGSTLILCLVGFQTIVS